MLLRITIKNAKYVFENHNQEPKSAAENQSRLVFGKQISTHVLICLIRRQQQLFIHRAQGQKRATIGDQARSKDRCQLIGG